MGRGRRWGRCWGCCDGDKRFTEKNEVTDTTILRLYFLGEGEAEAGFVAGVDVAVGKAGGHGLHHLVARFADSEAFGQVAVRGRQDEVQAKDAASSVGD